MMYLDLQALKFFEVVAKSGSISKAAKELNYAQSNLTARIKKLEADLQSVLFYRHNRGTTLTDKGNILLSYTNEIFQLLDKVKIEMDENKTPKGPLAIGSMETTAAVRLPVMLSEYHRKYPMVDFTLKTDPTEQNIQAVLQYELDGAFVAGPVEHPDLNCKTVYEENLVLVSSVDHQSLSSIKKNPNQTVLVFKKGCSYRSRFEDWLNFEGIVPEKVMELGTLDGIIGCVTAGLGISLLPESVVEKYLREGQIIQHVIPNRFGNVNTLFIYRKDKYAPISLTKFIEMAGDATLFG